MQKLECADMMSKALRTTVVLVFLASATSCATKPTWVPLDKAQIDTRTAANTTASVYELTYGQARYMNVAAVVVGTLAGIAGGTAKGLANNTHINDGVDKIMEDVGKAIDHMSAADARQESSEFEKKMGEYDVFSDFVERFGARRGDIKYFNIEVIHNELAHNKIITRLITYDDSRLDKTYSETLLRNGTKHVSAFKFQYGIGARAGGEQFGFTKTYRPYVRIVGLIKDVGSNRFVWGNKITLFSNTAFAGKDEARNASRDQLIDAYSLLLGQLVDVIVRDLNGDRFTSNEFLVDYDPAVDDVLAF
jgi:hypothetical protein